MRYIATIEMSATKALIQIVLESIKTFPFVIEPVHSATSIKKIE